jgi:hypothetical protein
MHKTENQKYAINTITYDKMVSVFVSHSHCQISYSKDVINISLSNDTKICKHIQHTTNTILRQYDETKLCIRNKVFQAIEFLNSVNDICCSIKYDDTQLSTNWVPWVHG